ncbi:MAG: hypothetical protein L3J71_15660 [Victivallaceae bacterium]|nr:hypothetical protein [Victivallaceae bacterium]
MHNFYSEILDLLSGDHHYMMLAAYRCLPENQQEITKKEAGLLIRYFCELPDCGWSIFGTLGEWEINNHFSYNIRRDLNVSHYLGWNPVTNTGERFGHDFAGSRIAIPLLLEKAVGALQRGNLRDGLAFAGAACHYFQDAVTFPEQQTLHRRCLAEVLEIDPGNYKPGILFKNAQEIPRAINNIYTSRIQPLLADYAGKIRQSIFDGDSVLRRKLHNQCDILGAHITADVLYTVLALYQAGDTDDAVNRLEQFDNIDEEKLPAGYFIDRDDNEVFQGYAAVEGNYPRGLSLRLTPGLQLRLSATGNSEVRWKQSIVDSILVNAPGKYYLKASAYAIDCTGDNGLRVLLYDDCWSVKDKITIFFKNVNGWQHIEHSIEVDKNVNAIGIEFFSRNNRGTILLDHWRVADFLLEDEKLSSGSKKVKLSLTPSNGYYQKDDSSFADQNEPVTSVRNNIAASISAGDEFVFDGKSFIEIPWHPLYAPLQVKATFELSLMLYPACADGEIMMSAVPNREPMSGWRLFIKNGNLSVAVYNGSREYVFEIEDTPLLPETWHSINLKLTPENKITVDLNGNVSSAKADFPRIYSNSGHFIGSYAGISNCLTGRIKNLQIFSPSTEIDIGN